MYRSYDDENGIGPTLYRSPREVREDVVKIKIRIKELNASIKLRELLLELLSAERDGDPEHYISIIGEALENAKEALSELRGLEEELVELEEELAEVRWIAGC